jgi:hypothetical protein
MPNVPSRRVFSPRPTRTCILPFYDEEPHILERIKLKDIKLGECRWPYGDPFDGTFAFCGRPTHKRGYCLYHFKRARVPLPTTQKDN